MSCFFTRLFNLPSSTPREYFFLETGVLDIETFLKARRIIYWHSIVNRNSQFIFSFAMVQYYRRNKKDWICQTETDFDDFNIEKDFQFLQNISTNSFKNLVKKKAKSYKLNLLKNKQANHSKTKNLHYGELELQPYLLDSNISTENKLLLISWRARMARFGDNYRGGRAHVSCPLCLTGHLDSQEESFHCMSITSQVLIDCEYKSLFDSTSPELPRLA